MASVVNGGIILLKRTKLLVFLNRFFKAPVHPFNLANQGVKTYAQWQFEKGEDTIRFYLKFTRIEDMFSNKVVLDLGCGAAGKSLFYASKGAKKVLGVEILEKYRTEAEKLAADLGLQDVFQFIAADAANLPLEDNSVDTIIINDAMEHVDRPEAVLAEVRRVLKPGGRCYLNFPPYYHPFGAHLSDAIYIPWVHMFFPEKVLIEAYKELVKNTPDGPQRVEFRISKRENGEEYFSYINHMTIKRFERILREMQITPAYYHYEPLRPYFKPFCKLPLLKEMFVKMVVCVIEK